MAELHIARDFALPLEAVTQTFAILAKRGVGKTYTASVLAEELLKAGLQVVVVDPIGVWWGLRAAADGKGPGLPIVILGGDHGDLPLTEKSGELIADLVVDERLAAVLDLSGFRKGEQTRFMQDFAERLYHRNRAPLHLVLDEADAFAPQRPMPGQQRLLGAIEDLVRRGRARGLGVTLVTQRAAVLNKDVLTQAEVLVALRTIAPQDRDAIDAWVRVHGTPEQREALMSSLPSLPVGTAWFWSPGWLDVFQRVQVRRRETFDSSATPKVGQVRAEPRQLAPVDLAALRTRLEATAAAAEANDPQALKRELADLNRRLAAVVQTNKILEHATQQRTVERVEVPVLDAAQIGALTELTDSLRSVAMRIIDAADGIRAAVLQARPAPNTPAEREPPPAPPPAPRRTPQTATATGVPLRAGERRMLEVLARHHQFKVTRAQLGTLAGFTPSGGTFAAYFGTLKRQQLLAEFGGSIQITPAGLDYLGVDVPPPPRTTQEIIAIWRNALRSGERRMLDTLVAAYPRGLSKADLGAETGFTVSGGTFSAYLGMLRRNGLAEVRGDEVRAADTLFLVGTSQ